MKNAVNKQPSDLPLQIVQPVHFTDQQSIEEVARLRQAPVMGRLTRLSGDEHPSPYQHNSLN